MMRKRESGQAFILVLILLAIGSVLVVPSLGLASTSLRSAQIVTQRARMMYAADAAQEYVMWKLLYDTDWRTDTFTDDYDTAYLNIDCCGISVNATVVMRAVEGTGGVTLATEDVIKPTKTVVPDTVPDGSWRTYTYTITLDHLSSDTSAGLDAIYDILPDEFDAGDYVTGSSTWSVDGGPPQSIPDPLIEVIGGQVRLQWPASYDYVTGTGGFSSPMRDFTARQVKELSFQVAGTLKNNRTFYNWVVLKPWDTLSGDSGAIITGDGSGAEGGMLVPSKTANPELILPGVETNVEYTISMTNLSGHTMQIQEITDYLPPEFEYVGPTSGITTIDPQLSLETINDIDRWVLRWTKAEFPDGNAVDIAADETLTLIFWAKATKEVSGSYYNEVTVVPKEPLPSIFSDIGITYDDFNSSYSWNSGVVLVPAYDSQAEAEEVVLNANLALTVGSITINSYHLK